MFNFMSGDWNRPKGPPEMVGLVTATVRSHNGSWNKQPVWSSKTDSSGYWFARISTKLMTKRDFLALLDDMNRLKIGVEFGSRADIDALP